jgi:hypothetical protein
MIKYVQRGSINKSRYIYQGLGLQTSTPCKDDNNIALPLTISLIISETRQIQTDQNVEMVGILEPSIPLEER